MPMAALDKAGTGSRNTVSGSRSCSSRVAEGGRPAARLHRAMRYAALAPASASGRCSFMRPVSATGVGPDALDAPAAAVELIHAYSLVHDDLPAMDDDDLRRGRPTTHRAFDEATAILAGDALQVLAFEMLANEPMPGVAMRRRIEMVRLLARASGTRHGRRAGDGPCRDRPALEPRQIEDMHARKTGALIRAAC